jgi:anti-sigma regulatory factor (Ser/Thr protein kinase)
LSSVADARHWAAQTFDRWELTGDAVSDAVLLTSELVTNAVLHARTQLAVSLAVADGVVEVGVSDADRRTPRRRPVVPDDPSWSQRISSWLVGDQQLAEGGRGLMLVDEMADEWGVAQVAHGKQVWFRLAVDETWPYRTDCPCDGEDLGTVRLDSGQRVMAVAGPWDDPNG